jgi:hypothetical protein
VPGIGNFGTGLYLISLVFIKPNFDGSCAKGEFRDRLVVVPTPRLYTCSALKVFTLQYALAPDFLGAEREVLTRRQ